MGNNESNMNKTSQIIRQFPKENTTAANICEASITLDPLSSYLQNRTSHQVKYKTLSQIQTKNSISSKITEKTQLNEQNLDRDKILSIKIPKIEVQRVLEPLANDNLLFDPRRNSQRKQSLKNRKSDLALSKFKAVPISQQSFIQIKQQPPEDHYQFKEMIGQGSYGKVFRAVCKISGELRAIKMLKLKLLQGDKKKQFLAQMTLLSKLNHPSIITLYDLFHFNKNYYVVMEYCQGGSVVELINKIAVKSEAIIAGIVRQLLRALSYMHSLGIIHRDIKLQNIVFLKKSAANLDQSIPIKIIDFGTAIKTTFKISQGHGITGTLSYIAPQVMKGILSEKCDIWSSGVLMHILLTGVSPFRGKTQLQTKQNINNKNLNYSAFPLSQLSQQAKDLLQNMLNKNFHKRYSALQALHHPWLTKNDNITSINLTSLSNLQYYYRGNNLISVIESFLSLRKVTQQERQKLADMFTSIDKDGNGVIQKQELIQILKKNIEFYKNINQKDTDALISSIDQNNSGQIDFNQFIIAMYDKQKLYIRETLSEAFQHFDRDKTGFIEIQELKAILNGGDAAQAQYFIQQIDTDNDKKISREQFIRYLINY